MKIKSLLVSTFSIALFHFSNAQESVNLPPYSDQINLESLENNLAEVSFPALDLDYLSGEDMERTKQGELERFAITHNSNLTLTNSGTWTLLPNGDRVWRLKITCDGAVATMLFFTDFNIPAGARMHVYNVDKSYVIGAFTSYNNHESGIFATDNIFGETCIIEYFEPVEKAGQGQFTISEVGHAYRQIYPDYINDDQLRGADPCEVDVACTPESNGWTDQIKSTVRIRVKAGTTIGWCSGTVVNNTGQNCTPYVLTAWHCGDLSSASDFNSWIMYFNYQKTGCGSGTASTLNNMTGCTMRANSNDGGGTTGSDFLLVEMNNIIPANYNPYFCGWDNTDYSSPNSTDGVGIHHPSGDVKKISTYTNNAVTTQWGTTILNTHWRITWAATTNGHGVTEGGSSGSGIFRADNKCIWGTLTGGSSFCTSPTAPDKYGKLSYHWISNGSTNDRQLKPWLDPINSNASTLSGTYYPCINSVQENELSTLLSIYPNPSNGLFNLSISDDNKDALTIEVYNIMGELIYTSNLSASVYNHTIDLSTQANGVYLFTVSSSVASASKKIIKE